MTTDIEHWARSRQSRVDLARMIGRSLMAFVRTIFIGSPYRDVNGLSPWLLRDIGLQPGPVSRIPGDGDAKGAANPAPAVRKPQTVRIVIGYGVPANDNRGAAELAA